MGSEIERMGWDDGYITGEGEGWAEPCRECRDPLNEDGSCSTCDTIACFGCGVVFPASEVIPVDDNGKQVRVCKPCGSDA